MRIRTVGLTSSHTNIKNIKYKNKNLQQTINNNQPQNLPKSSTSFIPQNPTLQVIPKSKQISFGYKHPIKDVWKKGLLPTVKKGLYGESLTKSNISLEHIIPHCKGGASSLNNYALASVIKNNERGNAPLKNFLTKDMAICYLEQFKDLSVEYNDFKFDGNDYIKTLAQTFKHCGVDVCEHFKELR